MADTKPEKSTKRRLRAPSQTVREQAEKAQADSDKPQRSRRLQAVAKTGRKPFSPIGRVLNKVFNRQPFRFIGRILWPKFLRESFSELRKVTWPGRKETRQLTFAVLMFAIVFGAAITLVDYGLDKVFKALILN